MLDIAFAATTGPAPRRRFLAAAFDFDRFPCLTASAFVANAALAAGLSCRPNFDFGAAVFDEGFGPAGHTMRGAGGDDLDFNKMNGMRLAGRVTPATFVN